MIGDACAHGSIDFIKTKKKFYDSEKYFIDDLKSAITEKEAGTKFNSHKYWTAEAESTYGPSKTWSEQLERINQFEDNGIKIPIYSFYLKNW